MIWGPRWHLKVGGIIVQDPSYLTRWGARRARRRVLELWPFVQVDVVRDWNVVAR